MRIGNDPDCTDILMQMLRQHQEWIEDVVIRLLCVFALDRFGDFVSDEVGLFVYQQMFFEHICPRVFPLLCTFPYAPY